MDPLDALAAVEAALADLRAALSVPPPRTPPGVFSDGTDRAADFNAWLAEVPDGTTIDLTGHSIRADSTLTLTGRRNLTVVGGKVYASTPGDRNRAHWRLTGCAAVTFTGHTVVGAHPNGGTTVDAYVADKEAQHGFDILGCSETVVEDCAVADVYGDFVYVGPNGVTRSQDTTVRRLTGRRNGRQGISVTAGDRSVIEDCDLAEVRRSAFDLEPATASWGVDGVTIRGGRVGACRLSFLAAKGAGQVDNVSVVGVAVAGALVVNVGAADGARRRAWRVEGCRAEGAHGSPSGWTLRFARVDGVSVAGNVQPLVAGRGMALVAVSDCTGVAVAGNVIPSVRWDAASRSYVRVDPGDAVELRTA